MSNSCIICLFFSDPLPRAVLFAYKARKIFMTSSDNLNNKTCIRHCDRAGRLLRESLKLTYIEENVNIIKVFNVIIKTSYVVCCFCLFVCLLLVFCFEKIQTISKSTSKLTLDIIFISNQIFI